MPTITLYATDHGWGNSSYSSSTDIKVGKTGSTSSDGTKYRARVRFDAPPQNVQITSIKLYMRRIDSYNAHTLQIGSSSSGAWGASLNWSRNISVSSGVGAKNWDITDYKNSIGAYAAAWYIHISHGSGTNSYSEFEGDGSSRPYVVIEYQLPASVPTVSSANVTFGTTFTVYTNREYGEYVHTVKYSFGGSSGTIGTSVATSIAWTPPITLASQIPSAASGTCVITCETYFGGALTGTKTCTLTQTVPSTVVPSITSISISEAVSGQAAHFGAYVQGKSRVNVSVAAAGVYGSTITAYHATLANTTYTTSSFTSGVLTASGPYSLAVSVTDSRGRVFGITQSFSVTAYSAPAITRFTAGRCNAGGTATQSDGTRVWVSVTASAASVGSRNTMACKIQYKLKSSGTWTDAVTLAHSNYTVNQTNYALPASISFAALSSYDVRATVSDYFGSVTADATINTKQVVFDVKADGTGFAFGKVAETANMLDVAWPARFRGAVAFDDKDAVRSNLTFLSGQSNTYTDWNARMGVSTHYVNAASGFAGAPSAYGMILNCGQGYDMAQQWFTQASGAVYHRQGNGAGWNGSADAAQQTRWTRFFDSDMIIPEANGGTGYNNAQAFRNRMGLGDTLGYLPVENGGTNANSANGGIRNLGLKCITLYTKSTLNHVAGTYYQERWTVERNGDSGTYTAWANGGYTSGVLLNVEGFYQISATLHWSQSSSDAKGMAQLLITNNVGGLGVSSSSLPTQGALPNVGNPYQYNGSGSATNTTASLSICVYIPAGYYVIPYGYLAGNNKTLAQGRFSIVRLGGA